jgi:hypothetical protein
MHRLLTLASAISLVLCLAFLTLWVRSRKIFGPGDQMIFGARDGRVWQVSTWRGAVWILTESGFSHPRIVSAAIIPHGDGRPREMTEIMLFDDYGSHPPKWGQFLGMRYRSGSSRPGLIQSESNWSPAEHVWLHDYNHTKTYEGLNPVAFREIFIPTLLPSVVTGVGGSFLLIPVVRWHRRRNRVRQGRCMQCGYDLRASTEKCPECAAEIPPNVKAATVILPRP